MCGHAYSASQLDQEFSLRVESISNNPVVNGLLQVTNGLLAVLDDHRRILSVNDALLRWLGFGSAQQALGLRPGEAMGCIHAHDAPGGCGEGPFCQSCGAALALVASLTQDAPVERTCAMRSGDGAGRDFYLRVHSCPLRLNGARIILLFLQDITAEQQASAVQRIFFHDVANTASALCAFGELLSRRAEPDDQAVATRVVGLARRLDLEIRMQRALADPEHYAIRLAVEPVLLSRLIAEMAAVIHVHPCARDRRLVLPKPIPDIQLRTDSAILMRVMTNMLVNAFEATDAHDEVRFWADADELHASVCAWNRRAIEPHVALRVFQRNFSTKATLGRGLGTYSMKLFTERFLHGTVSFTTSSNDGTTFRITLPRAG